MDENYIVTLGTEMMMTIVWVSAPALIVGMVVGIVMAIVQAVTSVQEQTLTIIPKILAVGVTLIVLMPFTMRTMNTFTSNILGALADAVY